MAHKRIIDPRIFKDETLISLSQKQALLYLLLWNYVENNGCGKASAKSIKADVLPFLNYTRRFVAETINKLAELDLIVLYCYNDQAYFYIRNFNEYQNYKTIMPSRVQSPGNFPRLSAIDVETENGLPDGKRRKKYTRKSDLSGTRTSADPSPRTVRADVFVPENDVGAAEKSCGKAKSDNINNIINNINNNSYTGETGENDRDDRGQNAGGNESVRGEWVSGNASFPQAVPSGKAGIDSGGNESRGGSTSESSASSGGSGEGESSGKVYCGKGDVDSKNKSFDSIKTDRFQCVPPFNKSQKAGKNGFYSSKSAFASSSSFDTDDFFRLALKRSYGLDDNSRQTAAFPDENGRKKEK